LHLLSLVFESLAAGGHFVIGTLIVTTISMNIDVYNLTHWTGPFLGIW